MATAKLKLAVETAPAPIATTNLTRNERLVFGVLKTSGKPLKAYDILEQLMEQGIRSPMTVYRALSALQERKLIHKVTHLNAFILAEDADQPRVLASVTCRKCAKTELIDVPQPLLKRLFGEADLSVDGYVIEGLGECSSGTCNDAAK